jgi:tRNA(Ile)-lysidine synthase
MPRHDDAGRDDTAATLTRLLERCRFPTSGTAVACAFSGGTDSTALLVLARRAGLEVTAHHVDHRLRPESSDDARRARAIADELGAAFVLHTIDVEPGSNVEARARAARRAALPAGALTGHTADDQAETVVLRLMRGSGSTGLSGITPDATHPILALRRHETELVCLTAGIEPVHDASNDRPDVWRNRVRAEVMPLLADIAGRDMTPILTRSADLLREESAYLDQMAATIDPTDAIAIGRAAAVPARRALRHWLVEAGYPPDAAAIERVMAVARGDVIACELPGGRRVERSNQRLRIVEP